MAQKRRLKVPEQDRIEELEDEDLPRKFRSIGWKEWLKQDYARYWFIVLAMAIDSLFGLEVVSLVSGAGSLGFVVFLIIAIPIEVFIYLILWSKRGYLKSEK